METRTAPAVVMLKCSGINCHTGFYAYPAESEPTYVAFNPGKATSTTKLIADYLISMDPTRFEIIEEEKAAAPVVEPGSAPAPEAAEKSKAKPAKRGKKHG